MAAAIETFHKVLTGAFISVSWTCATDLTQPGGKRSDSRCFKRLGVSLQCHTHDGPCVPWYFSATFVQERHFCDISFIAFFSNWGVSTRTKKKSAEIDLQPQIFLQCLFSHTIKKKSILVSRFQQPASWETCTQKQPQSTHTHTHTHSNYWSPAIHRVLCNLCSTSQQGKWQSRLRQEKKKQRRRRRQ